MSNKYIIILGKLANAKTGSLLPGKSILQLALAVVIFVNGNVAFSSASLLHVSNLHPRIFVRNDQSRLGIGIGEKELRNRLAIPYFARWRQPIQAGGAASGVEMAARYLEEGKQEDLESVRKWLATHTYSYQKDDVGGFLAGAEMATAYDWIYSGLSPAERLPLLANIVTTAESSRDFLLHGQPDINHNYTYMALATVAICGLVLRGEPAPYHQTALDYLELAREWIEGPGKVLDTWKARRGAWSEGTHYTFHETLRNLIMMFQAYRTASDRNYFSIQERNYDNFLARSGQFLIASNRPDWTMDPIGDCSPSRLLPLLTVPVTLLALAEGLSDTKESSRLRSFVDKAVEVYGNAAVHPVFGWGMRIFSNPKTPSSSFHSYPLFQRFGPGTDERIIWKNGGNDNSTKITVVAGNHFTDHQHFDKGQFLIYHGGGLAVDGGTYDSLYKPQGHGNNYACRTLAHNCLLLFDPEEQVPAGYNRDGGQKILRGLQHHGDWLAYMSHAKREDLDTAAVNSYDANEKAGYAYLRCDLARAYPKKVSSYDRQFLYLPDQDILLVYDRALPTSPKIQPAWLLHFQEPPIYEGFPAAAGINDVPKASLFRIKRQGDFQYGTHKVSYDGSLAVHTLLPENPVRKVIGGAGFEYYSLYDQKNYPPADPRTAAPPRDPGAWRLEVSDASPEKEIKFLHLMEMGSTKNEEVSKVRLIHDKDHRLTGAFREKDKEGQVIFFSESFKIIPVTLPLSYEIESHGPVRHLLTELLGLNLVEVEVNGKRLTTARISTQGVLDFRDDTVGKRTIVIKPMKENLLKLENQLPAGYPHR